MEIVKIICRNCRNEAEENGYCASCNADAAEGERLRKAEEARYQRAKAAFDALTGCSLYGFAFVGVLFQNEEACAAAEKLIEALRQDKNPWFEKQAVPDAETGCPRCAELAKAYPDNPRCGPCLQKAGLVPSTVKAGS